MTNYNSPLGLSSLHLFIPAPTLIIHHSKSLTQNGAINLLEMNLVGAQAQLLLFTLTLVGLGLLSLSLRELGGVIKNIF